jgi:carbon storage regulator CsrA
VLILSRKAGEKIVLGDNITITINRVAPNRVSLGIDAPPNVRITRGELRVFSDEERQAIEALRAEAKPVRVCPPSTPAPMTAAPMAPAAMTPLTVPSMPLAARLGALRLPR